MSGIECSLYVPLAVAFSWIVPSTSISFSPEVNLAGTSAKSGLICHLPVSSFASMSIASPIVTSPSMRTWKSLTANRAPSNAKCIESRFIAIGAISSTCRLSAYVSCLIEAHTSRASKVTSMSSHPSALALSSVAPKAAVIVSLSSVKEIALACRRNPSTRNASKGITNAVVSSVVSGEVTNTSVRLVVPSSAM